MNHVDRNESLDLVHIEPGDLLSTLGWLFFQHDHDQAAKCGVDCLQGSAVPAQVKKLTETMEAAQDSVS